MVMKGQLPWRRDSTISILHVTHLLHQSPKLGARHPLLLIVLLPARSPGSSATASVSPSTIATGATAVCHDLHKRETP